MTRRDYIRIARAIRRARNAAHGDGARSALDIAAVELMAELADDNPRFDREKFLAAILK